MKEEELKLIRDRVLKNPKLGQIIAKYAFEIRVKERGQFLSLIEESYKIGLEDGLKTGKQSK